MPELPLSHLARFDLIVSKSGHRPLPPEQLVESILEKERRTAEIVGNIKRLLLQFK